MPQVDRPPLWRCVSCKRTVTAINHGGFDGGTFAEYRGPNWGPPASWKDDKCPDCQRKDLERDAARLGLKVEPLVACAGPPPPTLVGAPRKHPSYKPYHDGSDCNWIDEPGQPCWGQTEIVDSIQGDPEQGELLILGCQGHDDIYPPNLHGKYKPPPGATLARPRPRKG